MIPEYSDEWGVPPPGQDENEGVEYITCERYIEGTSGLPCINGRILNTYDDNPSAATTRAGAAVLLVRRLLRGEGLL